MRELVQERLDGRARAALLGTCTALASAVAEHHTQRREMALSRPVTIHSKPASVWPPRLLALLRTWRPASVAVSLQHPGVPPLPLEQDHSIAVAHAAAVDAAARTMGGFTLPPQLLPVLTRLRLAGVRLTHTDLLSLRQATGLTELALRECRFKPSSGAGRNQGSSSSQAAAAVQRPLPRLVTLEVASRAPPGSRLPIWVADILARLAQHVTTLRLPAPDEGLKLYAAPHRLPHLVHLTVDSGIGDCVFQALLEHPSLETVAAADVELLSQDRSRSPCRWSQLQVATFSLGQLPLLPESLARLVVTRKLRCTRDDLPALPALRRRHAQLRAVPFNLSRGRTAFQVVLDSSFDLAAFAPYLKAIVLPPGGGPTWLEVRDHSGAGPWPLMRVLGPLLAGTRVEHLHFPSLLSGGDWTGTLQLAPPNIKGFYITWSNMRRARQLLRHPPPHDMAVEFTRLTDRPLKRAGELEVLCSGHMPRFSLSFS